MNFILQLLKGIPAFVIKYWKQSIFILTLIIACVGVSISMKEHTARVKAENQLKYYGQIEKTAATIISKNLDDSGRLHIQIKADENQVKQNEIKIGGKPSLVDTTANALKIAKDQIKELTRVNATLSIENAKAKATSSVINGVNTVTLYRYKDKYADMTFNPLDTTFGLKYNLNLMTTQYSKRSGILGTSRTNVIDLYSDDKRVTINGVDRYSVATKDPNFGFKIQTKAQYNIRTKSFTPALTGELNYKRLSLEGNYFYNTNNKVVTPVVSLKYDILKF